MEKKTMGRPPKTAETVKKLEEAFLLGLNISQACIFADITRQTYYNIIEEQKDILDRFKSLQQATSIKSILLINKAIDEGDISTAKWWLERKNKAEFSIRNEITGEDGEPIKIKIPEIKVIFTDEK